MLSEPIVNHKGKCVKSQSSKPIFWVSGMMVRKINIKQGARGGRSWNSDKKWNEQSRMDWPGIPLTCYFVLRRIQFQSYLMELSRHFTICTCMFLGGFSSVWLDASCLTADCAIPHRVVLILPTWDMSQQPWILSIPKSREFLGMLERVYTELGPWKQQCGSHISNTPAAVSKHIVESLISCSFIQFGHFAVQ